MNVWKAAAEYGNKGWCVLPLRPKSKIPFFDDWPSKASNDEEVIDGWAERYPDANLGVQFGPRSGIIDIECDDEEQEGNFAKIVGPNPVPTPTFQSAKGKHRLYRYRDDLPAVGVMYVLKIGCRIGSNSIGAQSVFPPSTHPSGAKYRWLVTPDECEVADIPDSMLGLMWNVGGEADLAGGCNGNGKPSRTKAEWEQIEEGVEAGQRNAMAAALIGRLLRSCVDVFDDEAVEVQWGAVKSWNRSNRPPLEEKELKTTYESILRSERGRRSTVGANVESAKALGEMVKGEKIDERWHLEIVDSVPPVYEVSSPLWPGVVKISPKGYRRWNQLCDEVQEQTGKFLPGWLKKVWEGDSKGKRHPMARVLSESASHRDAPPEEQRPWQIKRMVWCYLNESPDQMVSPDEEYDPRGRVKIDMKGDWVFGFDEMADALRIRYPRMEITNAELNVVMKEYGAKIFTPHIEGRRRRLRKILKANIEHLENDSTTDGSSEE